MMKLTLSSIRKKVQFHLVSNSQQWYVIGWYSFLQLATVLRGEICTSRAFHKWVYNSQNECRSWRRCQKTSSRCRKWVPPTFQTISWQQTSVGSKNKWTYSLQNISNLSCLGVFLVQHVIDVRKVSFAVQLISQTRFMLDTYHLFGEEQTEV